MGQERIEAILDRLQHPERGIRGALVAGTNGKGSTAATLASILAAAGLRVGTMPSPHLESYTERIQIDGRPIAEAQFVAALAELRPHLEAVAADLGAPTEFEILTALAVQHLAPRVERFVFEVGMGGRLDATNVLDLGVAVITNVALDHQRYLGNTLEEIAAEKAAIIKPGNVAISGCRPPALAVVEREAASKGATLWRLGQELKLEARSLGWSGVELDIEGPGFRHQGLRTPLIGLYQAENTGLAVAAAHALGDATESAVRQGLEEVRWPGRLEAVAGSPRVLLDGAHNPAALELALEEVRRLVGPGPLVVVFAAMEDKDLVRMAAILNEAAPDQVFLTSARSAGGRAASPEALRDLLGRGKAVLPAERALALAQEEAGTRGTVLVCGSLYLVGEVRGSLVSAAATRGERRPA